MAAVVTIVGGGQRHRDQLGGRGSDIMTKMMASSARVGNVEVAEVGGFWMYFQGRAKRR